MVTGRWPTYPLDGATPLQVPPDSPDSKSGAQTPQRQALRDPDHPLVTMSGVVPCASPTHEPDVPPLPTSSRPSTCSQRPTSSSQCPTSEADCLETSLAHFPERARTVLINSRQPSTRRSYGFKWTLFLHFIGAATTPPTRVELPQIFAYLLSLAEAGLSHSSIRVHLSAVSAYLDRIDGFFVFSHPGSKWCLKGLCYLFPPTKFPVPLWDLPLLLHSLMGWPFKPLAMCPVHLLAWKTFFLVAITSARRVSELAALRHDLPYIQFSDDRVSLITDITFLPKVVSEFHLSADIFLPTFFPHPSSEEEKMFPLSGC